MTITKISMIIAVIALGVTTSWAITITPGNPNNQGTDNVLFNDSSLTLGPGPLVQGTFNGSGSGYLVDFTSTSNDGMLRGSGGQATITGAGTNSSFTNLSFMLEGGATFTKAILNPDVTVDGTINFTITYTDMSTGHTFLQSFSVDGNGQNFFGISANGTEVINEVTFDLIGTRGMNASQFRIGGFGYPTSTPENGTTAGLLVLSLGAMELFRRTRVKHMLVRK